MSSPQHIWDQRYLRLAKLVALWSKDPSTQCGAVLVRPNKTLASVGFNGFARGVEDAPQRYADRNIKYPHILHSEWNALRACADPSVEGYCVYAWPMPPCDECTAPLVQSGVSRVLSPKPSDEKLERWKEPFEDALDQWTQSGAEVLYGDIDTATQYDQYDTEEKWHQRFLQMAQEVASWSKDPVNPRGAVLVRPDKTVASLGFNGYPQKVNDEKLIKQEEGSRRARLIPAELNAIIFSQESLKGCTLYTYPSVCSLRVANHMLQEEITQLVAPQNEHSDQDAIDLLEHMGVDVCLLNKI